MDSPGPKYKLPTTVGFEGHDMTLTREPAYSMAGRGIEESKRRCLHLNSPGPKYACSNVSSKGVYNSRNAVISSRIGLSIKTDLGTPGPDRYLPNFKYDGRFKNAPECPLGGRTPLREKELKSIIPGPKYNVPTTIGNPVQDKPTAPSWSIGLKTPFGSGSPGYLSSPGPGRYKPCKVNSYKSKSPNPVMLGPYQKLEKFNIKPGPKYFGNYNVVSREAPAYTFGVKHSWKQAVLRTAFDVGDFYCL